MSDCCASASTRLLHNGQVVRVDGTSGTVDPGIP
jgi:hypothetical protein